MPIPRQLLLVLGVFALACTASPIDPAPLAPSLPPNEGTVPTITLAPCNDEPGIECGQLEVWENRTAARGRKIPIFVKVLRATGPARAADPYFYFAGGPGESASGIEPRRFERVRERRDVVLVDQRGTGMSYPLACPEWSRTRPQEMLERVLPIDQVIACRDRLSEFADLRQYTTSNFVDDVNDVRIALGYEQINLHGGSYGTLPAQVFVRRYPEHVRSLVLQVFAPTDNKYPLQTPTAAQQALDQLMDACDADPTCANEFGRPRQHLATVLARFSNGAITVRWQGESLTLHLDVLMEAIRQRMYTATGAVTIPALLHEMVTEEDYSDLLQHWFEFEQSVREGDNWFGGVWLSASCTELTSRITADELRHVAESTMFGSYRPERHVEACRVWPKGDVAAGFDEPVVSDIPALLLSGALDPAITAESSRAAAAGFRRGLHVVVREGHSSTDGACASGVIASFVEQGTVDRLDTSCLEAVGLPPWPAKAVKLEAEVAERLAGEYLIAPGQDVPEELRRIRIVFEDGRLGLEDPGGPAIGLTPVSSTVLVFAPAGWRFEFRVDADGVVQGLRAEIGGMTVEYRRVGGDGG